MNLMSEKKPVYYIEEFEGRPTFCIETSRYKNNGKDDVKYLRFGPSKAKKVLALVSEIEQFVKDNENNVKTKN